MNDNLEIKWYLDRLNYEKSNENEFESVFDMMKMRSNIDFTFEELVKCLKIADNLLIREIIYENNIVQGEIENDVEIVADEIGTVLKEHNITMKEEQIDVFLHELIHELAKYKNPAFSEEKEIRLIYCDDMKFEKIVDSYGAFQEKWELIELKHDFRVIESNNITEFVKLDFDPDSIEEICIGPKCLLSKNDIKHILKKLLGVEKDVIESKSSYR